MRFLPHLLWLAQSAFLLLPSPAARAQAPPSGLGTATVDGLLSPGEWDGAATADASLRNAHGEVTAAATFFLMNDVDNLYLALKVAVTVAPTSSWIVQFDADGDGSVEVGDDWFGVEAGVHVDRVLRNTRAGRVEPFDDTQVGGKRDGAGLQRTTAGETVFELVHPLASGDAADFSLNPGSPVWLRSAVQDG